MKTLKMLLIAFSILIFSFCQKKGSVKEKYLSSAKMERVENFDSFRVKFYSDSLFQINRIIFPLESEEDSVMNNKSLEEKDPKAEAEESNYIPHNKNNWVILITDKSFRNDSVIIVDKIKYIRRFFKTDKYVEESILYAKPEYVFMTAKYRLIEGKWYLVDYQNELDNERS